QIKTSTRSRLHTHGAVYRPCTVVPNANSYTMVVEDLAQVMWVNALNLEGQSRAAVFRRCRTDNGQALNRIELFQSVGGEVLLVSMDIIHADFRQELHCGTEANNLAGHLSARFKALRRSREGGLFHGHNFDHGSAGQKWRQLIQVFSLAIEHADTGRTTHLVPGKCCEIHIECLEINRHVRHRLASVQHGKCTDSLCPTNDFIDLERIKINAAILRGLVPLQSSAGTLSKLLPWHQVCVVL